MVVPFINYIVRFLEIIFILAITTMQHAEYFRKVYVWRGVNREGFYSSTICAYYLDGVVNVAGRYKADAFIAHAVMLPAYDENHFAFNAVTAN